MFECCIYVISLHPTSPLCPSLQLLKFMVSYSSVIIVTYTCIHTLITMFCLIDFSVAYTSMCLGPTAWYWLVHHSLEAPLWLWGPVVIQHSVLPTGFWRPLCLCPQLILLSPSAVFPHQCDLVTIRCKTQPWHFLPWPHLCALRAFTAFYLWVVCPSLLDCALFSPFPLSVSCVRSAPDSKREYSKYMCESMRKETERHSEAPAFHWRGEHCLRFSTKRKNQEDSRRIKDIIIHLLFLCHCPEYHSYYFFPSHLVSSLSDTQLSYKSCRNDSCMSPAFTALCQTNPQRCLDTPSSLDTALMGTLLVIYLFPAD